jgi:hypothetical protein
MTRVAPIVPAESDLLCERCGYTLNGLPAASNCPECGTPIDQSIQSDRVPPAWEGRARSGFATFFETTADVICRPTWFYRTSTTRGDVARAARFADLHWVIATLLFATAGTIHARLSFMGSPALAIFVALVVGTWVTLWATTWAAARLTAWEANYRGIRLPIHVVRRGMYYHAAHYLPVALLALGIVGGYAVALRYGALPPTTITTYLYTLCAVVIAAAAYLFHTYWIGMRNMMYANR